MSHYDPHGTPIDLEDGKLGMVHLDITPVFTPIHSFYIPPSATHALVQTNVDAVFAESPTAAALDGKGFLFTRGSFRWLLGRTSIMNFRFRELTPALSGSLIVQFYRGSIGPIPPMQIGATGFK